MREDMARVIVERPRIKAFKVRKGRLADFDDMPCREGMKRGHAWRGDTKALNENLRPLRRYLVSQIGRPWNKVYSEITAHLRPDSAVQQHVRDHLRDFVAVTPRRNICFLPGFGRGLVFCGYYAVVTVSLPRWPNFNGLAVADAMKQRGQDPWRGLQVIDLRTGEIAEWFRFDGGVTELFDVALIDNIRCPRGLGLMAEEMAHVIRGE